MSRRLLLLIILLTILASGCVKNSPKLDLSEGRVKKLLVRQLKDQLYQKQWIEYNCADSGRYITSATNSAFTKFTCDPIKKDALEAMKIRNQVLDDGVGLLDSVYLVYRDDIRRKRSVGEFLADLAEIGASTAIGITNGERAIQVIGVALTGFRGGRKSAALNFYDEKTTNVLIKRMDASRSQILGEIKQQREKPTAQYSFDEALGDLIRYFDMGTLNTAFTELDKQTSVQAEIARLGVLRLKGLSDISRIPSIPEAQVATDLHSGLRTLGRNLKNDETRDVAAARLKTFYEQIAAKDEFDDIIQNLRDLAEGKKTDNSFAPESITKLKIAFEKIDADKPLGGEDYLAIIDGILSLTEESEQEPQLQKLLLDTFNAIQ